MMQESRDLSRDLLEVPETLTIKLAPGVVTFIDDLSRARSYPTDGSKQKYILGASHFEAKANWTGVQFKKDVEGAYGFKLTETYFLSPDAQRLFVIIRVGDQPKNKSKDPAKAPPVVGVNRVYDRVTQ